MFAKHQCKISAFARQNPDNMARVLKFVILSIRTRLYNLPADMATLENPESVDALTGVLYGFKTAAVDQITNEATALFWQAESIVFHAISEREKAENLLNLFTGIHGLGLAKAGFAAQLIYGVSACLDSHNLARFGISPNAIKSSVFKNAKRHATRKKIYRSIL